jgi:Fic family protein
MNPKEFKTKKSGEVIKTMQGYWAFVPAPPPPEIVYDAALTLLLSKADAALSELSGLGRILPNPDLLIAPYVNREAVASSRIEGTRSDLSDLLLDELAPERRSPTSDVLEVRNYVAAMNQGLAKLNQLPIAGRLVRQLHRVLMRGVRGDRATPGEYRTTQNWIGPAGSTINDAAYVPPPPDRMHDCLGAWERFVNQRDIMPDLVQCAILHEHFESIHPFIDGNGRIGRLLIPLFLIERGRLSKPLLYLSSYIEAHRRDYYDLLQAVRTDGDWRGWLVYFLNAVRQSATEAVQRSDSLLRLWEDCRKKLGTNHRAIVLLHELFVNPYVNVARAAQRLNVTSPTAAKTIQALEKAGTLQEMTGRGWGRYWVARQILQAVNDPTPGATVASA